MQAIERGEGDGTDWHGSKESVIQARADEQTIQVVLGKVYAKQQVFFLRPYCASHFAQIYARLHQAKQCSLGDCRGFSKHCLLYLI